jgi:regulator of RNase E activity RraA
MVDRLTEDELAALTALDTPTVCNALEVVAPKRRGFGYTTMPLFCGGPSLPPMVGYAVTATIRAMHPSERDAAAARENQLAYYKYVDGSPKPSVVVIQDLDSQPGYGSFWGEVNTNIHRGLGAAGVITNGSVRDLDQCAEGFQLLAGLVGPSHAYVRVEDFDLTVTVAGMTVRPGDLVHADRHGAVVVPLEAARRVPEAAAAIARQEAVIIEATRQPDFSFAMLAQAIKARDEIH